MLFGLCYKGLGWIKLRWHIEYYILGLGNIIILLWSHESAMITDIKENFQYLDSIIVNIIQIVKHTLQKHQNFLTYQILPYACDFIICSY